MSVATSQPRINAVATAVPTSECDATYHAWAMRQLEGRREAQLLERMMKRSGIGRRFTVLSGDDTYRAEGSFYDVPEAPSTFARMEVYAREAPKAKMLSKPFHLKDLVLEVERIFEDARTEASLRP